ncbi:MAG: long-chain fatty acid--CoA ligase [Chlorobiaceae bacterium]|nr:long-chain fatty acid--CoA ligase [Chlorobiaceae bacterium]
MAEKPWLRHYDKGVPHSLKPYPAKTLIDFLRESSKSYPDGPALLFKGASFSYGELERMSNEFASALVSSGIRKGDRVALLLPNSPQMIIAEFGIWKAGAIAVPINPIYTDYELVHAFNASGVETAIVLTSFYNKVNGLKGRTPLKRIIASNIKEYLPPLIRVLFTLFKEKKEGHKITLASGDVMFQSMIAANAGSAGPAVSVTPDDPAIFLFSGGTTGKPKCAVGRHHAMVMSGMQLSKWFGVVSDDRLDIIMLNMPLFHVYAQVGIMTAGLVRSSPLALVPNPRDIGDLLQTIKKLRPAVFAGVPTLFNALAVHPMLLKDPTMLKSIKLIVSGASALHMDTKKRFEELTGGQIIEAYGLTESMVAAVLTPALGPRKDGSVGIPAPDVEIRIINHLGQGEDLPAGHVGEVLMHAPQLMDCYWGNPAETADMIRDGWLYTGDLGYLDEDGFLFIVDRMKDIIKPGGFQVWPREVEEVIAKHPAVLEIGVAGVPDDYQVEAVKAWVVLREGFELAADELKAHCRKELTAYKVPKHVEFRTALPKSLVGKVLRRVLVEEHKAGLGEEDKNGTK